MLVMMFSTICKNINRRRYKFDLQIVGDVLFLVF